MNIFDPESILVFAIQRRLDAVELGFWNHDDPDVRESFRRTYLRANGRPPNGAA